MPSDPVSILKNQSKQFRTRLGVNLAASAGSSAGSSRGTLNATSYEGLEKRSVNNSSRVKFDLSTTSILEYEANRASKTMSSQSGVKSIMDANAISLALRSQYVQDDVLIKWLDQLSQHISLFDKKNEHLVDVLLELDWMNKSEAVVRSYSEVTLNLVTAFTFYTKSVLKMIVKRFTPILPPDTEEMDAKELNFERLHNLLRSILKLIPLASIQLSSLLADSFPYMKKSRFVQQCYVRNLLEITKYVPASRRSILELIVTKMIQLDVHCSKAEIEEAEMEEEEDKEDETIFKMEESSEEKETKHPLAKTLDSLLMEIYNYVDWVCYGGAESDEAPAPPHNQRRDLNWEATKKLYKELLAVFDYVVLPTHACAHVQFLIFYICSFRNLLFEGFIDYLWKKVQNPNVASVARQVSVCYLGSFVCRANYVNIAVVKDCLKLMCHWLHAYINNLTGSAKNVADANYHGTFYSVSQIVFYVIAFRHEEFLEMKDGLKFLQSLNLERLVTCTLNPLKVCLPTVVTNFAQVAKTFQIAYCYTVIEKNKRMRLPVAKETATLSSGYSSFAVLETFFPFDPYLLKRSGLKIWPLYRAYSGGGGALVADHRGEEEEPEEEEEEDDFIEDMVTGTTPSSPSAALSDVLSYGSSPGFKYSPKMR